MKVLIAPDKFKLTFSSIEIAKIIRSALPENYSATIIPMSDGGEGFINVIHFIKKSTLIVETKTFNPLMKPITAPMLFDSQTNSVYIELAKTGSLKLLPEKQRNPMNTTTYGLGIQIKHALSLNPSHIYIGLGGSSTTEMGIGMAYALGWKFLDNSGNELSPIGKNLLKIHRIIPPLQPFPVPVTGCVDVNNPLHGPNGAAFIYSPQKGASQEQVIYLDKGLKHLEQLIKKQLKINLDPLPGDGAAGGLGAGLRAFLKAKLVPGAKFIADLADLDKAIANHDIIITGEGKFDFQSFSGKVIDHIHKLSKKHNKPLIIIAGICQAPPPTNSTLVCLFDESINLKTAKKQTPTLLRYKLSKLLNKMME